MQTASAIVILLLVLLLMVAAYWAGTKSVQQEDTGDTHGGAPDQSTEKDKNKQDVLQLLEQHGELSNAEIRKKLGVSARTVVNYMDELEEEGLVGQAGDAGRGVTYRLN